MLFVRLYRQGITAEAVSYSRFLPARNGGNRLDALLAHRHGDGRTLEAGADERCGLDRAGGGKGVAQQRTGRIVRFGQAEAAAPASRTRSARTRSSKQSAGLPPRTSRTSPSAPVRRASISSSVPRQRARIPIPRRATIRRASSSTKVRCARARWRCCRRGWIFSGMCRRRGKAIVRGTRCRNLASTRRKRL